MCSVSLHLCWESYRKRRKISNLAMSFWKWESTLSQTNTETSTSQPLVASSPKGTKTTKKCWTQFRLQLLNLLTKPFKLPKTSKSWCFQTYSLRTMTSLISFKISNLLLIRARRYHSPQGPFSNSISTLSREGGPISRHRSRGRPICLIKRTKRRRNGYKKRLLRLEIIPTILWIREIEYGSQTTSAAKPIWTAHKAER